MKGLLIAVVASALFVIAKDVLFVKVADLNLRDGQAKKATLLANGSVVYFWERTRPATKEEKDKRSAWLDQEWQKLQQKAKELEPKIAEAAEKVTQQAKEQAEKSPVTRPLVPFFSLGARFPTLVMREGLKLVYPLAKRHFVNQPVVTAAGVSLWHPDGKQELLTTFDLDKFYGEEEWMRLPSDGINLRPSLDGRYLAMQTESGIILFALRDKSLEPIGQIHAISPFGFSPSNRFFYATDPKQEHLLVFTLEDLRLTHRLSCGIDRGLLDRANNFLMAAALSETHAAIATWLDLGIYRLDTGALWQPPRKMLQRIGPPRNLLFSRDGSTLYIAGHRGLTLLDIGTLSIVDQYIRHVKDGFRFELLASISPDGRYAAALYGRERDGGWATLFIWDIRQKQVVQYIGKNPNEWLDTIGSGWGGTIYPPATFTEDWSSLLVTLRTGTLQFYKNTRR